ncbi:hypothetical protein TRICI_002410 [Trichomonascus ciferrii]|uniref:Uncharacterized protein n=1 Tax=Trichomonascus ciferrii TaxID=44093 RepID=A0A642V5X4_9ASCO|nr:hypothetical protein TRICI_002410 [Trichomonascus ciferrii]
MKKRKHERDYIPKVLETNGPVKIGKKVTDLCVPVCWRYKLPMQLVFSEDCQNLQRVSICMLPFGAAVSLLETVFKQSASLKVLEFRAMSFNYSGPPANLTAPQSLKTRMVANCTFPLRNKNQPPILSLPIKTLRIGCVTHSNLLKCIHLPNLTEVSWTNGVPCQWCQKSHVDWIAHKLTSMEYVVPGITKELVLISVRKAKELHYDSLSSAPLKNISLTYYTMDLSPNCFPLRQGHKSLEFIGVTIRHSTSHYEESAFSAISHVDIVALLGFQQCISNKFPRLKTVSLLCEYEYTDCINNTPPFVFTTQFIHALYTVENGSLQMALRRRDFELRLSK